MMSSTNIFFIGFVTGIILGQLLLLKIISKLKKEFGLKASFIYEEEEQQDHFLTEEELADEINTILLEEDPLVLSPILPEDEEYVYDSETIKIINIMQSNGRTILSVDTLYQEVFARQCTEDSVNLIFKRLNELNY